MTVPRPQQFDGAVSRRQFVAGAGSLAIGGTAFMAMGSRPARAEATVNDLSLEDASHSGEDGSVEGVTLSVSGSYSFETNGADSYSIDLAVASAPDADDWQSIDWTDGDALANSSGGSYDLSGSVLAHDSLEAADFSADAAETTATDVPVQVLLTVTNGSETVDRGGGSLGGKIHPSVGA